MIDIEKAKEEFYKKYVIDRNTVLGRYVTGLESETKRLQEWAEKEESQGGQLRDEREELRTALRELVDKAPECFRSGVCPEAVVELINKCHGDIEKITAINLEEIRKLFEKNPLKYFNRYVIALESALDKAHEAATEQENTRERLCEELFAARKKNDAIRCIVEEAKLRPPPFEAWVDGKPVAIEPERTTDLWRVIERRVVNELGDWESYDRWQQGEDWKARCGKLEQELAALREELQGLREGVPMSKDLSEKSE